MKTKRIGWKIVEYVNSRGDYRKALLKLEILGRVVTPDEEARVSNSHMRNVYVKKLRTSEVKVLRAFKLGSTEYGEKHRSTGRLTKIKKFNSKHDFTFKYETGKIAKALLDTDKKKACASGLHFFEQRRHAIWWANR